MIKLIIIYPPFLENWLFKKLFGIIFIFLGDKIDFDRVIAEEKDYKKFLKWGIEKYLEINEDFPALVLDLATGTGAASLYLAKKFPESLITGVDISNDMLKKAREKAQDKELINLQFDKGDIYDLHYSDKKFDLITVSNAPFSLTEVKRVLKSQGYFLITLSKGGGFLAGKEEKVSNKLLKYGFEVKELAGEKDGGLFLLLKLEEDDDFRD